MKLLLYADLHSANIYSFNIRRNKFNISEYSRIDELYSTLEWLHNIVVNLKIDLPINLGDIFHNALRIYLDRLNYIVGANEKINSSSTSKKGIMVRGNHDVTNEVSAIEIFKYIPSTIIVNNTVKIQFFSEINSYFVFIPYIRNPVKIKEIFDQLYQRFYKSRVNVYLFCHLDIKEAFEGLVTSSYQLSQYNSYDDLHLEIYKAIFSGHLHFRKKIRENFYYIGSTLNHNFSDKPLKKNAIILKIDPDGYEIEEIINPFCPIFIKMNLEREDDVLKKIKYLEKVKKEYKDTNIYCRIYSMNNELSKNKVSEFLKNYGHFFISYDTKTIDTDEELDFKNELNFQSDQVNVIDLIVDFGKKMLELEGKDKEDVEKYISRLKNLCQLN